MFVLGVVLVLSAASTDAAALPAAVAGGGLAGALALLAVTVDETDEAFANVYSAGVSLQNLVPRVPQRLLVIAVAVVATVGALAIDLRRYESFLLLLGSFFVPLFGVLLARLARRGARTTRRRGHLRGAGLPARARSPPGSPASPSTSGSPPSGPAGGPISSTRASPRSSRSARRCRASRAFVLTRLAVS